MCNYKKEEKLLLCKIVSGILKIEKYLCVIFVMLKSKIQKFCADSGIGILLISPLMGCFFSNICFKLKTYMMLS